MPAPPGRCTFVHPPALPGSPHSTRMLELANTRWIGLALILIDLVALATIWLSERHSTKAKLVWTAMVVVLPVLGALSWVVLGREPRRP